ncbi:MucBP domain-containing protein [Enterococcus cecorum]|nr:MucBP domain-containing protein [Enterococcus cecorum]
MIKIGHLKISILNMGDEEVRNQTERQLKFGLKKKKGGGGAASFIIGSVLLGAMIATPVIANNQNAVVFAAESADTTSGTDTYNYQTNPLLINKVWNLVERIPFNKNINDLLLDKGYTTNAYKLATTTIGDENNEVNATVTITPLKDAYEGISVLQEGKNQASYAATSDMFIGNPNPSKMPALGILTQPAPDEGGNDWSSKFNFNGDFPVAILKISFDKVVTNPVIDVSGIGGSTSTDYLYHGNFVYARGSFNSTVLELLDSDVSLKTASGVNLTDGSKEIRVKERNTYYRAVLNDGEKDIEYDTSEYNTNSPKLVPAGTGSIQVLGDVKEISFKVYHSATPYSAFPTETYGTSENFFRKDKSDPLMADGTNGLNKHWREEYRHENDPKKEFITSNDDLFRLSLRLPSASVTVHYVDENGNQIKDDEIDTPTSVTGTSYDTTDNKHKEIQGKDGKYYTLLPEEKAVKEGSAAETGTLKDKNLEVTYVYQLNGAVKERHVIKDTETELFNEDGTETARTLAEPGSKIGTAYQGEQKSTTLYDADGNMYKPTDDKDGREDNATGSVKVEEQTVTFEYAPVKGNVVVHYVDENGNTIPGVNSQDVKEGNVTKEGNPYDTTTETYRPQTVTATDGTKYELVSTTPKAGSASATGNLVEGTQEVTYVYKKVPAHKVTVTYVDTEGKEIKAPVVDEASLQEGKAYDTAVDNKPQTIEFEGKKYEFVKHEEDSASETGTMADKDLTVTYVYRLVEEKPEIKGGEVKERHVIQGTETELVDENGQATSAIVKAAGSEIGEAYNTQPKEGYLYDAQGNAYKAIDDNDGRENNASGVVTAAEQTVTFEYAPVKGNVVVNYEDEEGNPIPGVDAKDVVRDGNVTKEGNPYDTTTETYRPQTVTATDGTVYELVKETPKDGSAPAEGTVKEGTQEVTYVYKKVPAHKVTVTYVDTEGKEIKAPVVDEASLQEGKAYDTAVDNKPQTIEFEGKKYEFVKHEEDSASETGTMADKDLTVTYVYRLVEEKPEIKGGEVKERHVIQGTETELVDENGQATSAIVKAAGSEIGEAYNTQPKEGYLYDAQGNAYKAIDDNDGREDNAQGKVTDKAQTVTFEYTPVKGNVVVHYVDENGNTIPGVNSQDVKEGNVTKSGTPYDTTTQQFRPQTVVATDGTKYELVSTTPKAGSASATGNLVEGTQEVTYVYRKVVEQNPEVKGGQVVERHVIQGTETELVDANGQATTAVVKEAGSTIGEAYSTQPKSGYLYDAQGNAYKAIGDNDGRENNAQGKVTELNQTVTFEYTPVKGNVVVHYVDENGNTIPGVNSQDVKEGNVTKSGTPYDTTTQQFRPQTVVATDGTKYELVSTTPKAGSASATGNLVEGTQEVTYVYRKVVEQNPEVKGGQVVERHVIQGTETELVDANGQATTAVVKEAGSTIGEAYSTQPKSGYLYDAQGNAYKAIGDNDGRENNAQGKVTELNQTVTFEYAPVKGNVIVDYVDEAGNPIPGVPAKDVVSGNVTKEGNPYDTRTAQFRPQIIISSDGTRYELVSTTPKDGSAFAKGNIKEGTQTVTYVYRKVATHTVTINYVDTDGNTIKQSVVDETALVNGEAYDTTDEGDKPKEIKVNGKVYELVKITEDSAPEKGKMGDKDLSVTYVYKLKQKGTTVKSSKSAPVSKNQLPKAGSNQTNPVVGVMSLAMASLLAIVAKFKKEETK